MSYLCVCVRACTERGVHVRGWISGRGVWVMRAGVGAKVTNIELIRLFLKDLCGLDIRKSSFSQGTIN